MAAKAKPKILCVDDEHGVLDALERLLRKDFAVLKASSGDMGLKLLQEHNDIAVVLTDHRMPTMTGVEFLIRAKSLAPNATRAILSGQIDTEALSAAINSAEIHRFILKPWDNEVLRLQMLEALQTHVRLTERSELHALSITDPITQLTNHRYFQEKLTADIAEAERTGQPVSLIMVDVDHFKSFNDRYGHPEGDRLLLEVAQRLRSHFPENGMASRYGGEEFAVVLRDTRSEQAAEKAEGLRMHMELNAFQGPGGRPAYVTVSMGVATFPHHGQKPSEIVENADKALYQAKRQGRNQVVIFAPQPGI